MIGAMPVGSLVRVIREPMAKGIRKGELYRVTYENNNYINIQPIVIRSDWSKEFERGWYKDRFEKVA